MMNRLSILLLRQRLLCSVWLLRGDGRGLQYRAEQTMKKMSILLLWNSEYIDKMLSTVGLFWIPPAQRARTSLRPSHPANMGRFNNFSFSIHIFKGKPYKCGRH